MKKENSKALYAAFKAGDRRFDGRFFVGVTSTGIYCRPTCHARMPKEENCIFFESAAEAEQAGFRPCLVCRPELAPTILVTGEKSELARQAARFLEENCGTENIIRELADRLGYTDRHLRRIFFEEYHVTPVQYIQTCRLLLAKNFLTDTSLSITDVAMAAGFGSLRRFNDLFKKHYHLTPSKMRKSAAAKRSGDEGITVAIGYKPPYQWQLMLKFLGERAIPGVEAVRNGQYLRTVRLRNRSNEEIAGWVKVGNDSQKSVLYVTMSESLLTVMPLVLARIRNLFDTYCDPQAVGEVLGSMNKMKDGLFIPGLRVPGCIDIFELSVRAILGQQVTVKAAGTLAGRIAAELGAPLKADMDELKYTFPSAEDIAGLDESIEERLGVLGVINSRARAIKEVAGIFADKKIQFEISTNPEKEMDRLMEVRGIGPWTARYIAMRGLNWTDAFLETDLGIKKAFGGASPDKIIARAEEWRPWRSYATMALWNSL